MQECKCADCVARKLGQNSHARTANGRLDGVGSSLGFGFWPLVTTILSYTGSICIGGSAAIFGEKFIDAHIPAVSYGAIRGTQASPQTLTTTDGPMLSMGQKTAEKNIDVNASVPNMQFELEGLYRISYKIAFRVVSVANGTDTIIVNLVKNEVALMSSAYVSVNAVDEEHTVLDHVLVDCDEGDTITISARTETDDVEVQVINYHFDAIGVDVSKR